MSGGPILLAVKRRARRLLGRPPGHRHAGRGALSGMTLVLPEGWDAVYVAADYEPRITAALSRIVRPGDVCVDAGAHYGYFTLLLARLSGPDGRVVAFEAQPDNARIVRANVRANRLRRRVVVEQAALSGRQGTIELVSATSGGSSEWTIDKGFAVRSGPSATDATTVVRSIRLDEYFASAPRIDVVKMDIEGAEAEAVPAMSRLLERLRPTIVLEFHREVGWPAIEALLQSGYRLENLDGATLPQPGSADEVPYQLVARPSRT